MKFILLLRNFTIRDDLTIEAMKLHFQNIQILLWFACSKNSHKEYYNIERYSSTGQVKKLMNI